MPRSGRIPDAAIRRLPVYMRELEDMSRDGIPVTSSAELAGRTGFTSEQIRKDLAYFGAFGTRGVGYDTSALALQIRRILGLERGVKYALVGAGNLGTALARYAQARIHDVVVGAIFDSDPQKVGQVVAELVVQPVDDLAASCRRLGLKVGVIAVPAEAARSVLEALDAGGCQAVLNFAPVKLSRPPMHVQNLDLTLELESITYYTGARLVRPRSGVEA